MATLTNRFVSTILLLMAFSQALSADEKLFKNKSSILAKLEIKIPRVQLESADLFEAVAFLRYKSREFDRSEGIKGVNFVISESKDDPQIRDAAIKDLSAQNLSVLEILNLVCLKTKTQYRLDDHAIVILPLSKKTAESKVALVQRKWTTPPNFLDYLTPPAAKLDPPEITTLLTNLGVIFPPDSSATYLQSSHSLIVSNTSANLHLIDGIVKASGDPEGALMERQAIEKIILPEILLNEASLAEVVEFLRLRTVELDPAKKGINLNVLGDEELAGRIIYNLELRNIPVTIALKYICSKTQTRLQIQGRNISILPKID